ncbi:hypothetical protein [Piscinibacter sp.]|jgi:acyl-CoA hydrolase
MTVLKMPEMANFVGIVHGGTTLKLRDQVAQLARADMALEPINVR